MQDIWLRAGGVWLASASTHLAKHPCFSIPTATEGLWVVGIHAFLFRMEE